LTILIWYGGYSNYATLSFPSTVIRNPEKNPGGFGDRPGVAGFQVLMLLEEVRNTELEIEVESRIVTGEQKTHARPDEGTKRLCLE